MSSKNEREREREKRKNLSEQRSHMIDSTKTATAVLILRSKLLTSNDGTEMTDVVQTLKISSYQTNFQITCLYD